MESQIEINRNPEAAKGFAILNLPEQERLIEIEAGKSAKLGWTSRGRIISCLQGSVWVTQEQDLEDYILHEGESFITTVPGRVIVQALEEAAISITKQPRKSAFSGSFEQAIFK